MNCRIFTRQFYIALAGLLFLAAVNNFYGKVGFIDVCVSIMAGPIAFLLHEKYDVEAFIGFLFICLPSVALIFLTRRIKERNFKMIANLLFILSWFITGALSVVMSR